MQPAAGTYVKNVNNKVNSAVLGWTSTGSLSKWSRLYPGKMRALAGFLRTFTDAYHKCLPELCREQLQGSRARGRETVGGTAFRTMFVNRNFRTALHCDKNVQHSRMGAIAVAGHFEGGQLQFPEYGVEVDVRPGDLLFFSPGLWHCNRPLRPGGKRVSLVCHG